MRGQSRTRQTLSDAREPMNLEDWFGDPGHMVIRSHVMITERKMAVDDLLRIVAEKPLQIERKSLFFLSLDIEAHGHMGSCCLHRREK